MLRESGKVKAVRGNNNLELQAEANESYRVRDIMVDSAASAYVSIYVDKVLVGYYRTGGNLGNHLHFPLTDEENSSVFGLLVSNQIFRPIPVPKGSKLQITGAAQAGATQVVVYDEYDENDVRSTEPNGPESNDYDVINYGRSSATLVDGDNRYTVAQTPNQFPDFPFGETVPGGRDITLYGILASDVGQNDGTNEQLTQYLKLIRNRKTLFDDDLNGLPFFGVVPAGTATNIGTGQSIIGNHSATDQRLPFIFDAPLQFHEGEDLDIVVNTSVTAGTGIIVVGDSEVAFIERVREQR